MAYTRPKTNYRPLQYTPQNYNPPPYEPLPYNQRQPTDDFYEQLFKGTEKPTPPPEPASDYMKRYEEITGKTPNRLAYQQAIQEGYPEIQRDKLSKALAIIGAVGGTWATKDPAASTRAAMEAYNAPQARASARYKEKLTGLENLATMEDKDIAGKIRALEFERGDTYARSAEERARRSETRDIAHDAQALEEAKIRMELLGTRSWTNKATGILYEMDRKGNVKAVQKVQNAEVEDVALRLEEKRQEEAITLPGKKEIAKMGIDSRERIATQREMNRANSSLAALAAKAAQPNATEEFQRQVMNLRNAAINAPYLMDYVKETPVGLIPKSAADFLGGKMDQDDIDAIAKVTAALNQGGPPTPRNSGYTINPHDNTVTFLNPQRQEENKSFESVPYWEKQPGYTLKFPKSSNPADPAANAKPPAPAANTAKPKYPVNPDGTVTVVSSKTGEEDKVPEADVDKFLEAMKDEGFVVKGTPVAAPASTTTTTIPPNPTVQTPAPTITAPEAPKPASITPPQEPVSPYPRTPYASDFDMQEFPTSLTPTTPVPRPVNNPFTPQPTPPPVAPAGADPNAGMPISNRLMQNRFGPANVFGANIPLPQGNQQAPPPQKPPIDLMPAPQPQRISAPPQQQRQQLPPNPIQLAPPVNEPAAPPPAPPINNVSGVPFGQVPQNQMNRMPFGQASRLTSPLTNPLMLSGGENSMNVTLPPAGPKKFFPDAPPSAPVARKPIPEKVKEFDTKLQAVKDQFKQETGYELKVTRGGNVTADDQYKLFLEGRPDLPGGNTNPVVTPLSGKPGDESTHQFGEGSDVVFMKDGKVVDITDKSKSYKPPNALGERLYAVLGRIAEQKGLEWGGKFDRVDWPHLQLPQPKKEKKEEDKPKEKPKAGKKGKK